MSGKFMRVKRIVIPTLTMIVIASQLIGCSSTSKTETSSMLDDNSSGIEVEVAVPDDSSSTENEVVVLSWVPLSQITDYSDFRDMMDENFEITTEAGTKQGCIYIDLDGHHAGNNTLFNALHNKKFRETISNEELQSNLGSMAGGIFVDLEDSDQVAAIYDIYFRLLPSTEKEDVVVVDESSSQAEIKSEVSTSKFNGSSTLTRSQAMALVMRASTPVTASGEPENYTSFTDKVGLNSYTPFAAAEDKNVYLSTETGLDSTTAEGSMTRGEYVYLVMTSIYGTDAISKVDTTKSKLTDCTELKDATGTNAEILTKSLKTPTNGAPTEIVKALVKAQSLGAIDPETRWDEAITKTEAIDIYVNSVYKYAEDKQIQIEKEEAEKLQAQYTDEAKKFYKEDKANKDIKFDCTEAEYVEYYISERKNNDAEAAHAHTTDYFVKVYKQNELIKKQKEEEERKKKEEEERKKQEEQNNNNGGGNNNNNGGGNNDNGGGGYTPPSDNDNNGGGGNNDNGGGGNNDTPPTTTQPPVQPPPDNNDNGGGGGDVPPDDFWDNLPDGPDPTVW